MPKRKLCAAGGVVLVSKRKTSPWSTMPIEALEKIFSYAVVAEGSAFPCLMKLGKVCSRWKFVADMPHLWSHLRFTPANLPNERIFRRHFVSFKNYAVRFKGTHTLVCCGLECSAARIVNEVCVNANQIRKFALIQCGRMGHSLKTCLKTLRENHSKSIQSFTISQTEYKAATLKSCVLEFGKRLTALEATHTPSMYYTGTNCSFDHLENLTTLKLQGEPYFSLKALKDLKLLKTLHITDSEIIGAALGVIKWPDIEDCNFSCSELIQSTADAQTNTEILQALAFSPKVKRVNLHGRYMDVFSLMKVLQHCNEIEYLNITVVKDFHDNHSDQVTISCLVNCIGDSLQILCLNESVDVDGCLYVSRSHPEYWHHITDLSLELTNIKADTLKFLLHYCLLNIQTINLCRCRELPRGCKRKWTDISALKKVLEASE